MGISLALIGAFAIGISSVYMKKLARMNSHSLVALSFQYFRMIIFVLVAGVSLQGVGVFTPVLTIGQRALLVMMGIVGAIGIWALLQAYRRMPAGIALIGANLCVCFMYGVNIWLFDNSEVFSPIQMIVALVFLSFVALLLTSNSATSSKNSATSIARKDFGYSLCTAISWTIFFGGITWFVKEDVLTPLQSVLFSEVPVATVLLLYAFVRRYARMQIILSYKDIRIHTIAILASIFLIVGNVSIYMAYVHIPANSVNIIKLGSILVTALGAAWLLQDYMKTKQWVLLILAMLSLVTFVALG